LENADILQNDPGSIRYRRESSTLVVLGTGVIVFGIWNIVKLIGMFAFRIPLFTASEEEDLGSVGMIFAVIIAVIILSVDVLLRVFVGIRARREGKGKKAGRAYLVYLVLMIITSVISVCLEIYDVLSADRDFTDSYTTLIMELTSLVVSLEVFMAGIYVRRFRAKAKEGSK
jgi:phosphotransferase system  glucose/maltose/N-acetylglucosamine-specific IIC component